MKRGMMIAAVCALLLVGCSGQDKTFRLQLPGKWKQTTTFKDGSKTVFQWDGVYIFEQGGAASYAGPVTCINKKDGMSYVYDLDWRGAWTVEKGMLKVTWTTKRMLKAVITGEWVKVAKVMSGEKDTTPTITYVESEMDALPNEWNLSAVFLDERGGAVQALTPKTLTVHAEKTMDLFTEEMIPASFERAAW